MKKLLVLLFMVASFGVNAGDDDYPDKLVIPTTTLEFKPVEIKVAVKAAFSAYGWEASDETDTSIRGKLPGKRGGFTSTVQVDFSAPESIVIKYLTEHDRENYKFYKRLLNIRAIAMVKLTDCKNPDMKKSNSEISSELALRRNLMYAFYKYKWNITSITKSKIKASLAARGRMEADISVDGAVSVRHWDEIEEEFTDPANDGYVRRIKSVLDTQQRRCAK